MEPEKNIVDEAIHILQKGMSLPKCLKCGCMREVLKNLHNSFPHLRDEEELTKLLSNLYDDVENGLNLLESTKYSCLGCKNCYPAEVANIFNKIFPDAPYQCSNDETELRQELWPFVPGEYFTFPDNLDCSVAVSTLTGIRLAEKLAVIKPEGLCIVGKTETENIGIEKVVKNIITNPNICSLLLTGKDSNIHFSGQTLLALWEYGVDRNKKVRKTAGKNPVLRNVTSEEIEVFRSQVKVVDMIGCEDIEKIVQKIKELSQLRSVPKHLTTKSTKTILPEAEHRDGLRRMDKGAILGVRHSPLPVIYAGNPDKPEMDKKGYFVILPQPERKNIIVEHYSYTNKLQRVIEGRETRDIYLLIINNGWITELSHAAYLGKELMKAELSIKHGIKYVQDKA